ncbi:NADH:flavin oxidoreductase/NADH oxidase [Enterovirga aerilata]|uniref:NADH:flavin oxidoreductase/NADH oxidase n=1 Tax=Enterovirga aerilata TaxID=2730920 RepID=A0A849IE60_9HYPH|nr:NADH:flavin oxidoreductase/NADH oxidase [Enterovirga sp. DB1703]NNM72173.1 NADH:flavin oxidoreductase/NADH oxidase [Enterovirga sp. DB1703]
MSQLFSPVRIGPQEFANRIVISPMCQYSAIHGDANDWHMVHLGSLAMSGAALLVLEATAVEEIGRISHGDLGLYGDENEAALHRVLGFCRKHGSAKLGIQLAHAGRKGSAQAPWEGGRALGPEGDPWETVAPSALPFAEGWHTPREASEEDLDRIVAAFAAAAERAVRLGFEVIEVHAAHGYLLHQFLSPVSNRRADQYGGSLANRMRFPLRVFEAVSAACPPEVAIGARITGSDWIEGGIDIEEAVAFAAELKARGCHYVDVTSGGIALNAKIQIGPGYQVPFAAEVRRRVGMPVWSVGLIVTPEQAEDVVASGQADMVALARTVLDEPHWPWTAAQVLGGEVVRPPQYQRAAPAVWPGAAYKRTGRAGPRLAAE